MQGNDLHDERFDQEAVNLDVQEAVEMAGEDCGVSLGQQLDLFGTSGKELLARWLNELSSRKKRSCHLFCVSEKTMLLFVDSYNVWRTVFRGFPFAQRQWSTNCLCTTQ